MNILKKIKFKLNNYCYWLLRDYYINLMKNKFSVINSIDSIRYIVKNGCSVSRYGDGEFDLIFGKGNGFQDYDPQLANRLKEILKSNATNHIVCIPYVITDISNLHTNIAMYYAQWIGNNRKKLFSLLDQNKIYYNSLITRFYIDFCDKSKCEYHINLLRKIWSGREIIIVEGNKSRVGVGNDLFSGARSIKRVLAPAENAFDRYDEILASTVVNTNKGDLILLALGMTATVLAYDLHKLGYQAIDLGHIDLEYEWFKMGASKKEIITGKYTNEVQNGDVVEDVQDKNYLNQIVADIS